MKIVLLLSLLLCNLVSINAQFTDDLFESKSALSKDYHRVASRYESLKLNSSRLSSLKSESPASLRLQLPFENKQLRLVLEKKSITAPGFSVIEALPGGQRRTVSYEGATFYQGKIEGKERSVATISIFNGQVMGIIADEQSNIILGAIDQNGRGSSEYVLYRENDLVIPNPFACGTSDTPVDGGTVPAISHTQRTEAVGEPIDIYFECDNRFYQDKGSNTTNVINYVLGFFNNTALLYQNENVQIQVSQILVWTTQDPEAAAGLNTTSNVLTSFASRMASATYIGDYAHFLSTRSLGGGIAYLLSNPCSTAKQFKTGVSAINNTYSNFPTYSWTVEVVTHELGHNLGSNHTQWCGWVGGALDNCFTVEGSCAPGPQPVNGGTIMSYCHLVSTGINLANGFGQQPGDRIRAVIGAATCFGTCRMTVAVAKTDASCGDNNGSAVVSVTDATGAVTYTWSNGQVGATLSNVAAGTYHVTVKDAANCQVMEDVTIVNLGANLNAVLSPAAATSFCTGGNVVLTVTNNASYSYQWSRNGAPIPGATTNSYTATTTGLYAVNVVSGACSVNRSVQITEVTTPTANISAGSATTFCEGSSVVLNGNAGAGYSYQWYRNTVAIPGATAATYTALTSGNYTVKVFAGTCEATSIGVSVTVNPAPLANVSAGGATSFCVGGNVTLTANAGTGYTYQWLRNGTPIPGATNAVYVATTAGLYTATVTSGTCSKTSTGDIVSVLANPVVTVTPATSTIQKFQTQLLTGQGALTYNWSVQPALVGSSATTATVKPLTTTIYTIEGTDANGCKGTANATVNVIGCGDVTNINSTVYSPSRVTLRWTNPSGATTDTVRYRKVGVATWTKIFVTGEELELNGLEPGAAYEYDVTPLCTTTSVYIPSATQTFNTPALQNGIFIRLFPNPVQADGRLEIIVDKPYTLQVAAYDNGGKKVMLVSNSESLPAGQVIKTINAAKLANGVYHIVVYINGKSHSVKMVVAH